MNQIEYLDFHAGFCSEARRLAARKNDDYAGRKSSDAFRNFRLVEQMGHCSTEAGILTRLSDKLQRLVNVVRDGASVTDETADDTLLDIINYSTILAAVLQEKRDAGREEFIVQCQNGGA